MLRHKRGALAQLHCQLTPAHCAPGEQKTQRTPRALSNTLTAQQGSTLKEDSCVGVSWLVWRPTHHASRPILVASKADKQAKLAAAAGALSATLIDLASLPSCAATMLHSAGLHRP